MSLYEEALADVKNLKRMVEEDVRNKLIEEVTPTIREHLAAQLAGKAKIKLLEEEDPALSLTSDLSTATSPGSTPASVGGGIAAAPSVGTSIPSVGSDAPIKVAGGDSLNMPLPGSDGKLIFDFETLWSPNLPDEDTSLSAGEESAASAETPPEVPGSMPSPEPVDVVPTAGQDVPVEKLPPEEVSASTPMQENKSTYKTFKESLESTAKKINCLYETKAGVSVLVREAAQEKLFNLLEDLNGLTSKGVLTPNLGKIFESRLEILHLKLKETPEVVSTYHRQKEIEMSKSRLQQFASTLLEGADVVKGGDVTSPADSHKIEKPMKVVNSQEQAANKAGKHAKDVSEPSVTLATEALEKAQLEEELKALLEGEGEGLPEKEGEQDLAGAASSIPNKKVGHVDTTVSTSADKTNPASHVLSVKESIKKQIAALQEQLKECGDMSEDGIGGGVPGSMKSMEEDSAPHLTLNFDLAGLLADMGGLDKMSDDTEVEIVDDEPEMSSDMDSGSEDEMSDDDDSLEIVDDDEEVSDLGPSGLVDDKETETKLNESKKAKLRVLAQNAKLKTELNEANLYNTKVVHLQPFLMNTSLTREQKQKIVERLDRATTVEEVKETYTQLKNIVEGRKSSKKTGLASKPLNSSAAEKPEENLYEGKSLVESEKSRLQILAGIVRK